MLGVIILAAGQGTRMNSKTPKVLHKLGGKPIIQHVLDTAQQLNPQQIIVVTSTVLKDHSLFKNVTTIVQEQPKGTADAVKSALPYLESNIEEVMILSGDTPLIRLSTLYALRQLTTDINLISMPIRSVEDTYGRIICDDNSKPLAIVEYKDATLQQRQLPWANSGVYKIKTSLLSNLLPLIIAQNANKEYYLTDLIKLAYEKGYSSHMIYSNADEFQGINNRQDLSLAEYILQQRWRKEMMDQGVTLYQPETIILNHDTKIGQDSCIGPFVTFGPQVELAEDVTVSPYCHLEYTKAESGVTIGPFAHSRGNTLFHEGASVGNFVEVKGSTLGKKVKAKHLAYLGDATIGENANIGAGTITCNYDGFKKSKTTIGKNVMVGANSSLVAPLTVGDGAIVAAGSVVTQEVPEDALVISRSAQVIKEEGAKKIRIKNGLKN